MDRTSRYPRTLVLDDDPFALEVVGATLRKMGLKDILSATSGERALSLLQEEGHKIELLLCDLNMPGMDGVEFLRHLARSGYRGKLLLLSGVQNRILHTVDNLARAHGLNVIAALEKPLTLSALAGALKRPDAKTPPSRKGPSEALSPADLERGIRGDELVLHYQPKVEIATGKTVGVEALVRWKHPVRGLVGPDAFVPVAEEHGLIDALTDVVFTKAVRQAGAWRASGLHLKVAVNVSMDNLTRLDLPELLIRRVADAGIEPSDVILEITESRLTGDLKTALEILARLRLKGIGLSIDDFGTGFSTLEKLRDIPFAELKIDRRFVTGATGDREARTILESSAGLARNLGLSIVAEGVETREDWDLVAGLGCHLAQGYLIAKPMPGDDLFVWARAWPERQRPVLGSRRAEVHAVGPALGAAAACA